MCVTRSDQSERVICRVIFRLGNGAVFRVVYDEIFALFQAWVGNFDTIPPWKVVGTLYLDSGYVTLNILLSWELETSLNCLVMCKPPRWFKCYFRRSSWIHCWLLLAVLSDYFGHLVIQPLFFVNFGVYTGLPLIVFPLWGVEGSWIGYIENKERGIGEWEWGTGNGERETFKMGNL